MDCLGEKKWKNFLDKWSSGLLTEASLVFKYCEIQLLQLIPKIQRQQQQQHQQQRSQRQKAKLKNHQYRTSSFQGKCNESIF